MQFCSDGWVAHGGEAGHVQYPSRLPDADEELFARAPLLQHEFLTPVSLQSPLLKAFFLAGSFIAKVKRECSAAVLDSLDVFHS
ncbi:hypothetical protein D5086_026293 [Populus alba]|uniref:Uncharacterized protein n=2 Tax=Populus TaxID=3689 RepID=A0ACC4B1Z1_POPAL|nr:hypothetical protein NC653_033312 [Populus alba x Populus x berolinensis]